VLDNQDAPQSASKGPLAVPLGPKGQVIAWLLDGRRDEDILADLTIYFPDVRAKAVLAEVVEHFEAIATGDKTVLVGWAIEALRDLYRRMIEAGEFEGALRAVKELAALVGKHKSARSGEAKAGSSAAETSTPRSGRPGVGRRKPSASG